MSSAGANAHRVLIIDDDQETTESLRESLLARGFAVDSAKDGGQAQATFMMRRPDFVILDLMLPRESGFEICERIKQIDRDTPVLILTVIDMSESRSLAERVGADGYLVKPVDAEILIDRIREISESIWERTHLDFPKEAGRVRFSCRCGKRFRVSTSHRGKTLSCPECGEVLTVPRRD